MSTTRIVASVTLLLLTCHAVVAADDVECGVSVAGNVVTVRATHENQTPAVGVTVALLDAAKTEIARGHTNADGVWSRPADHPGSYRVVVTTASGREVVAFPFTIRTIPGATPPPPEPETWTPPSQRACCQLGAQEAAEPHVHGDFPWLQTVLGLACLGGFTLVYLLGGRGEPALLQEARIDE